MHLATSYTYHSPEITKIIVTSVAGTLTILLGLRFFVAYRRNQRLAREMGGLTATESQLNRVHGVMIVALLLITMALGVGAVMSPTVRDVLSDVGDNSRWLPTAFIPVVLLYGRWLSRRIRRASRERAELGR